MAGAGLVLAAALDVPPAVRANSFTLTSARDNTLFQSDTGALSNGAGPAVYVGNNSVLNTRRALLFFDVAAQMPTGITVVNAELRLHVSSVPVLETRMVTLHRVLRNWGEGTSYSGGGAGSPAQPGDATWLHRFAPDSLWSVPGGDFVADMSAATAVPDTGSYVWSGPQLVADVQSWIDDPASEFGWILLGEEGIAQTARRIDSREADDPSLAPVLWIDLDPVAVDRQSWGKVKGSFR